MKHHYILYAMVFFAFQISLGQQEIDSITPKKIKKLDSLARINPEESLQELTAFYDTNESKLENAPIALEQVYYAFSKYHYYLYQYDESIEYSKKGKNVIAKNNLDTPTYFYDNMMAAIFANQSVKDSAAYYFTKSADALAGEGKYLHAAQINYNIASIYTNDFNLEDGFVYFRKSLDFYNKVPDSLKDPGYSFMMGNMGYVYEKGDSLSLATTLAREALNYGKKFNERNGLIYGYLTLSDIFKDRKKPDSSVFYSTKAYNVARENQFKAYYPTTAMHLAKFKAEKNPEKALALMEEIPLDTEERSLNWLGNIDQFMGELYTRTKNFEKASYHLNKFIRYQDSVTKSETEIKAADILEKYKAAQKDLTIAEKEAEILEKENENRIIAIISIALGLLVIALFFILRQRKKNQKQKITALENEKENIALKSLMTGEEKERSRIAKELHDGLGGILAVSKMHASTLEKSGNNTEAIKKLTTLLDTASKESRRISHNLLPENLMLKGLDVALQDFIHSIKESNLLDATYQSINVSNSLPQPLQLSIYRIVQELLNNIIKHSEATEALVQLQQEDKKLTITVEDNGKGFSPKKISEGIGLTNIKSRLSLLKGKLEIDSNKTSGTSVYIELQLEK